MILKAMVLTIFIAATIITTAITILPFLVGFREEISHATTYYAGLALGVLLTILWGMVLLIWKMYEEGYKK